MSRGLHAKQGYTLIEFSIAASVVLSGLLVIFDVARVVQTHAAVKEAAGLAVSHLKLLRGGALSMTSSTAVPQYRWSMVSFKGDGRSGRRVSRFIETTGGDRPPGACSAPAPGAYCERVFSGYSGSENPESVTFNSEAAYRYIENELKSVLPDVQRGCVDRAYCVTVATIPAELDTVPVGGDLTVSVTYLLPLVLLGNNPVRLTATSTGKVESDFRKPSVSVRLADFDTAL